MGSPMIHSHQGFGSHGMSPMMAMFVPIPMAIFGVIVAFMFGATLGMKVGEKRSAAAGPKMHGPWGGPMPMGGPKPWMKGPMMMGRAPWMGGMPHHHHHGGAPCMCEHPEAEASEEKPADEM